MAHFLKNSEVKKLSRHFRCQHWEEFFLKKTSTMVHNDLDIMPNCHAQNVATQTVATQFVCTVYKLIKALLS